MTLATRMRSFLSRFTAPRRAAPAADQSTAASATDDATAASLRDTIPVRRWHCQRLPIRFSLRWPSERRADRDSS
jgi:hypothetical protein